MRGRKALYLPNVTDLSLVVEGYVVGMRVGNYVRLHLSITQSLSSTIQHRLTLFFIRNHPK